MTHSDLKLVINKVPQCPTLSGKSEPTILIPTCQLIVLMRIICRMHLSLVADDKRQSLSGINSSKSKKTKFPFFLICPTKKKQNQRSLSFHSFLSLNNIALMGSARLKTI